MFDARAYHRERLANLEATTGPDAEPWATDRRLREYAHQRARLDAAESLDMVRAEKMRIHIYFGCATILEYLERRAGYSVHAARERLRVARCLATLPMMASELAKGNLSFSTVRELSRVATPETEEAWVERTKSKTCREVEEMVAGRAPGDTPDDPVKPELRMKDLRLSLPTEHHALWREVRKKLAEELGAGGVSDAAVFEALCRNFLSPGTGAESPPHQIAYKQCDTCKQATQNGAGREFPIVPSVFERAACDARIIGSLDADAPERARSTVSPRMREQVFARDAQRCAIPGCRSSRNLEVHHIVEQALGGSHAMENLTTLCGGHHAARHEDLIEITGRAPAIKVRWLVPSASASEHEEMRNAVLERELDYLVCYTGRVPRGTSSAGSDQTHALTSMNTSPTGSTVYSREHRADVRRGTSGPRAVENVDVVPDPGTSSSSPTSMNIDSRVPRGTSSEPCAVGGTDRGDVVGSARRRA